MSAWRALVLDMYRSGLPLRGTTELSSSLTSARNIGVIAHGEPGMWVLTPLGVEYCEGRVVQLERRPGGRYFAATWLRSLPQGISLYSHEHAVQPDRT
jgi:hypothetical protein